MKVCVTGGAGFIGANLCRHLVADGDISEVVVLDDLSAGTVENLSGVGVELIEGTILDAAVLDRCMEGTTAVVHLAARPSVPRSIKDPVASHNVNVHGTFEVLEAVRRADISQFIFSSSSSVYGANPTLPKDVSLATRPVSPYAAGKLAAEAMTLAYGHSFGLGVLAFRFFNVYGPLQPASHSYAAVVPAFVSAALAGEPLPVFGDGHQTRDFTFVDTVCDVITSAIRRRVVSEEPVNLAFGTRTDLVSVITRLELLLDRELPVAHHRPRAGDVRDSQAAVGPLEALFPDVAPVSLDTGLKATVDWFQSLV